MTNNPHYVTPDEAERKRCVNPNGPHGTWEYYCKHKECMAWRWDEHAPIRYKGDGNPKPTEEAKGYCGMVRT